MKCEWEKCPGYDILDRTIEREDGTWHEECLHGWTAEQASYWRKEFLAESVDESVAYEPGDYKAPGYVDDLLDRADDARKER